MIKEKPEVGDVYQDEYGDKILVTNLWDYNNENSHTDCISEDCRNNPFYLKVRHIALKDFKFLTYIGKNTTESKDLFKVENNERCIEDNTPHAESTVLFKDLENVDD